MNVRGGGRSLTTADGLAHLEREHGLTGALRVAPGVQRECERTSCTTTKPRSGAHAPRAGSRRWKSPRGRPDRGTRGDAASVPRGVRACVAPRHRRVGDDARARDHPGARPARAAAPFPRRARPRAPRRPACAAAGSGLPAPVRFLPKWDNVLLGFADRTRVLPERHRKTVIRMNGDVAQTFLVDGFVAGIWRVEGGRVVPERSSAPSLGTTRGRGRGGTAGSVPRRLTAWSRQSVRAESARRSSWRPIACCCGGSPRMTSTTSSSSTAMPT